VREAACSRGWRSTGTRILVTTSRRGGASSGGEPLDEPSRAEAEERGSLREAELAAEVIEERPVAEVDPQAPPVKVRERDEKLGLRDALAAEEVLKTERELVCVRHEASIARVLEVLLDARACDLG